MKEQINDWTSVMFSSMQTFADTFMKAIPLVVGALLLLLLGWLVAKFVRYAVNKVLHLLKFDELADKVKLGQMLRNINVDATASQIVSKFAYWLVLLLFFVTATDTLGWTVVSQEISKLIGLLPRIFSAIVLFAVGIFIAGFVRDFIRAATGSLGVSTGKLIGGVVFYFLATIITLTSLQQAGVNTEIITENLSIILGAVLLASALAYGLAAKDVFSNMLGAFFNRKRYAKGQVIEVDNIKGTLVEMDNISLTIDTGDELVVIPSKQLVSDKVRIKK